jgi:hypothetical protein
MFLYSFFNSCFNYDLGNLLRPYIEQLRVGGRGNGVSIYGKGKNYCILYSVQIGSGHHQ